jgi:hypothetical protein
MASIWSRNKIWGAATFNTDVDVADNSNNASVVPATSYLGLKLSTEVDTEGRNRSKWFTSVIGQLLRAVLHKEEDRATGANIGVSGTGIESTQTVYTTPEQLPEVTKTTNDFSTPAKSDSNGTLTTTNDLFNVTPATTDRKNKNYVVKFSDVGVLFFKARTWLQSELVTLINETVIDSGIASRVGTITSTAHTTDDDASRNIIIDTRTIGKGGSGAILNDDKYETLWKHLYDKYPDAICTLNVARTTRDADWTNNRTLTLPKIFGRVIVGKDLTQTEFDTIGEIDGKKTHILTQDESAIVANTMFQIASGGVYSVTPGSPPINMFPNAGRDGDPHNNLQPYVVLNYQITY